MSQIRVSSLKQWGHYGVEMGVGNLYLGDPWINSTLNSKWKLEEMKEVYKKKIGRFMYSKGLLFNTVDDPYWTLMINEIVNFGYKFKPAFMHELRTWILKEEMNDINIMMEEHKKAWK